MTIQHVPTPFTLSVMDYLSAWGALSILTPLKLFPIPVSVSTTFGDELKGTIQLVPTVCPEFDGQPLYSASCSYLTRFADMQRML